MLIISRSLPRIAADVFRIRKTAQLSILVCFYKELYCVVCFLLGNYPASGFYIPTFRNTLSHLHKRVDVSRMKLGYEMVREKFWLEVA